MSYRVNEVEGKEAAVVINGRKENWQMNGRKGKGGYNEVPSKVMAQKILRCLCFFILMRTLPSF